MKRSPLTRKTALKPRRKKSRTPRSAALSRAWHDAVVMQSRLPVLFSSTEDRAACYVELHGHHVVDQQVLRARARERGVDEDLLVWDVRVGARVTKRRHQRHHSRHEPITRGELLEAAPAVFAFAAEWGLEAWLDRHYPSAACGSLRPGLGSRLEDPCET